MKKHVGVPYMAIRLLLAQRALFSAGNMHGERNVDCRYSEAPLAQMAFTSKT